MRLRYRVALRHPFHPEWEATPARLARGTCRVLSGGVSELAAAREGVRPERAVFALQHPDEPFITKAERDLLWEKFEVPVYAMLLDRAGQLAGWECEAQDGLHLGSGWVDDALWAHRLLARGAALETNPCECGRPGRRLRTSGMDAIPRRGPGREERREAAALRA